MPESQHSCKFRVKLIGYPATNSHMEEVSLTIRGDLISATFICISVRMCETRQLVRGRNETNRGRRSNMAAAHLEL